MRYTLQISLNQLQIKVFKISELINATRQKKSKNQINQQISYPGTKTETLMKQRQKAEVT